MLRLDRAADALAAGQALIAGNVALHLHQPIGRASPIPGAL